MSEVVLLKCFGGRAATGLVEYATDTAVYIRPKISGHGSEFGREVAPVGFPISEVYRYDATAKREIASGRIDWSRLTRWAESETAK